MEWVISPKGSDLEIRLGLDQADASADVTVADGPDAGDIRGYTKLDYEHVMELAQAAAELRDRMVDAAVPGAALDPATPDAPF